MPKKRTKSPTAIATEHYTAIGFEWGKCDQRIPHTFISLDLFNAFDAIAIKPDVGIIGVQVTSRSNHAARRTKLKANPIMRTWIESGGRIEVCSTKGVGDIWREELTLDDLATA